MTKLLTVVIPAYNVEKYLPEILPTFLDCAILPEIELLIIDDGSTDGTAEIGKGFEARYPNTVRLISKANGGHGSAINAGIKNASGRYLRVVDGDDWVDTDAFRRYVEKLRERDEDLVMSPYNIVDDGSRQVAELRAYPRLREMGSCSPEALTDVLLAMHAMTFKTALLRKIRPISEHCFYVDIEFILYPLEFVQTVAYIDETVYQYRVGNAGQSMALANMQKNRAMHLRVCENIAAFYQGRGLSDTAREIVRRRLVMLYDRQMSIFLSMPPSGQIAGEVRGFSRFVMENTPELCGRMFRKGIRAIVRSKGRLYRPVAWLYRLKDHRQE